MHINKVKPKAGQESVWDYPRPPRIEPFDGHIRIIFNDQIILDTNAAYRILETSHPPTYYLPMGDFKSGVLKPTVGGSFCEYKGMARYFSIVMHSKIANRAAWGYPDVKGTYVALKNCVAVYAQLMDACYVNDEKAKAQDGGFYGGWVTSNIVGPFKGGEGTWGW